MDDLEPKSLDYPEVQAAQAEFGDLRSATQAALHDCLERGASRKVGAARSRWREIAPGRRAARPAY